MKYLVILAMILMVGCQTIPLTSTINRVDVGMSKAEVIGVMGEPGSVSAKSGIEYMYYELHPQTAEYGLATETYFVRLIGGKVESYGKLGDFDSTQDPTINVNINK